MKRRSVGRGRRRAVLQPRPPSVLGFAAAEELIEEHLSPRRRSPRPPVPPAGRPQQQQQQQQQPQQKQEPEERDAMLREIHELRARLNATRLELDQKRATVERLHSDLDREIMATGRRPRAAMARAVEADFTIRALRKELEGSHRARAALEAEREALGEEYERLVDQLTHQGQSIAHLRARCADLAERVARGQHTAPAATQTDGGGGGGGGAGNDAAAGQDSTTSFLVQVRGVPAVLHVPQGAAAMMRPFASYRAERPVQVLGKLELLRVIDRIYTACRASEVSRGRLTTTFPEFVFRFFLERAADGTRREAVCAMADLFASVDQYAVSLQRVRTFRWWCRWPLPAPAMERCLNFFLRCWLLLRTLGVGPSHHVADNAHGTSWITLESAVAVVGECTARWETRRAVLTQMDLRAKHNVSLASLRSVEPAPHPELGALTRSMSDQRDLSSATSARGQHRQQRRGLTASRSLASMAWAGGEQAQEKEKEEKDEDELWSFIDLDVLMDILVTSFLHEDARCEHAAADRAVALLAPDFAASMLDTADTALPQLTVDQVALLVEPFASWETAERVFHEALAAAGAQEPTVRDVVRAMRAHGLAPVDCNWQLESFFPTAAAAAASKKKTRRRMVVESHLPLTMAQAGGAEAPVAAAAAVAATGADVLPAELAHLTGSVSQVTITNMSDVIALARDSAERREESTEQKWQEYTTRLIEHHKVQLDRARQTFAREMEVQLEEERRAFDERVRVLRQEKEEKAEALEEQRSEIESLSAQQQAELSRLEALRKLDVDMVEAQLKALRDAYMAEGEAQAQREHELRAQSESQAAVIEQQRELISALQEQGLGKRLNRTRKQLQVMRRLSERAAMAREDTRARVTTDRTVERLQEARAENVTLLKMLRNVPVSGEEEETVVRRALRLQSENAAIRRKFSVVTGNVWQ